MNATPDDATPLCVDLDGTLVLGDLSIESALALLKRNPLYGFAMLWWATRGLAFVKHEIARRVTPDVATLPWDHRVLQWVKNQSRTRPCLLVSASNRQLVQPVAEHLGFFTETIASDAGQNLAGSNKARVLVERFGERGFDYIGNSRSDLAVWPHARQAILANTPRGITRLAHAQATVGETFPRQRAGLQPWLHALRLPHWAKNLLVFAPLIAAHRLQSNELVSSAIIAWFLFSLCTSGTYLLNDLLDLDADRRHPYKRHRSLASGRISLVAGLVVAPLLIVAAFLGATALPASGLAGWLAAYLVLTIAYSFWVKRLLLIDAAALACLFTIRILAGGAVTGIPVSTWLLALALLLFFSLALLKRYTELHDSEQAAHGRGYRPAHLQLTRGLGLLAGAASVAVLAIYIASPTSAALYSHPIWLTGLCVLLALWLARVWHLASRGKMHDDPIMFAWHDWPSWLILILAAALISAAA